MSRQSVYLLITLLIALLLAGILTAERYTEDSIFNYSGCYTSVGGYHYSEENKWVFRKRSVVDKELERLIKKKTLTFVNAVFQQDEGTVAQMLAANTEYIRYYNGASIIRHVSGSQLVEGYMATDKTLVKAMQKWCVEDSKDNVVAGISVYLEGVRIPQNWFIYYHKEMGSWKIYILENGV